MPLYLKIILSHAIRQFNLVLDADVFYTLPNFNNNQKYEQQLFNELETHLRGFAQSPVFASRVKLIVEQELTHSLTKAERQFLELFKQKISGYLYGELGAADLDDFMHGLWASWFLELFVDVYVHEEARQRLLTYTTHDILNKLVLRFSSLCLFFDDEVVISAQHEKRIQRIGFKILQGLVVDKLAVKRLVYTGEKEIKSINMYQLKAQIHHKINLFYLKVNLVCPTIITNKNTPYSRGLTYLNVNKIMLANITSRKEFNLRDFSLLHKLFATQYVLDEDFYHQVYPEVIAALPSFLPSDNKPRFNLGIKFMYLSAYWYHYIFISLKDEMRWLVDGFYWNYMFDFRGRLYVDSVISYQSAKVFRHLYGYKIRIENTASVSIIDELPAYLELIIAQTSIVQDYPFLDCKKYGKEIFWLFIEIAKIFKTELLSPQHYMLKTKELIELAIKHYKTPPAALDLEQRIELLFIHSILARLNAGTYFNFIIFKDATASALQLLTLVLGVKDLALVEVFNLNSRTAWYDPYTYIIGRFLGAMEVEPHFLQYFTRKILKKTIMTYNYSATLHTCLQNFYDEIKINAFESAEQRRLTEYFVSFYKFLEALFEDTNFFHTSLAAINDRLLNILKKENSLVIYLSDESSASLEYYLQRERRMNAWNEYGARTTTVFWETTHLLDWKKTTNALKPNTIHALDAALVREILSNSQHTIATIHDSFGASLYDVEDLINLVNKSLNLIYYKAQGLEWYTKKNYYSIYVIF